MIEIVALILAPVLVIGGAFVSRRLFFRNDPQALRGILIALLIGWCYYATIVALISLTHLFLAVFVATSVALFIVIETRVLVIARDAKRRPNEKS